MSYKWNHSIQPFETGFFSSAQCIWDSSKLWRVSIACPFLLLSGISLHRCITVYPFTHWKTLGWFQFWRDCYISICVQGFFFCEHSFHSSNKWELLSHGTYMFNLIKNCPSVLHIFITNSKVWEFYLLCILFRTWYCQYVLFLCVVVSHYGLTLHFSYG